MNLACVNEMIEVLEKAATDDAVRVIVLLGSGEKAFTAGADISEIKEFNNHL